MIVWNSEWSVSTFLDKGGSARRTGVSEEEGVSVVITNEEIKIFVIIDIGEGWNGIGAKIRYSKLIGISLLDVSWNRCEAAQAAGGPGGVND